MIMQKMISIFTLIFSFHSISKATPVVYQNSTNGIVSSFVIEDYTLKFICQRNLQKDADKKNEEICAKDAFVLINEQSSQGSNGKFVQAAFTNISGTLIKVQFIQNNPIEISFNQSYSVKAIKGNNIIRFNAGSIKAQLNKN